MLQSVSRLDERDKSAPLAVILPTEEIGGHETMLLEWLGQAAAKGLEIEIHCRAGSALIAMAAAADIPTREIRYPTQAARGWTSGSQNLRAALIKVGSLPRAQPVLLAPGAMQASLTYLAACVVFRRRIVCYVPFVHDGRTLGFKRPLARDWVTSVLARRVRVWVTINALHRHELQQRWGIRSPIFVVANRLRSLSQSPQIAREHGDALPLRVLYLGRFDAFQKGLDWLSSILEAKPEWASSMHFTFQGRGWYLERLRTLTASGSSAGVAIAPWGNVGTALGGADVLLISSRFEGFPLVAIEALHHGVPVVATHESGLDDILPSECVFHFGDAGAMAECLRRMSAGSNRKASVEYGRANLARVLAKSLFQEAVTGVVDAIKSLRT